MTMIPEWVDELIEWDHDAGLTIHAPNHTTCIVPRTDTAQGRTVRLHEFLHAQHDKKMLGHQAAHTEYAEQAIADVFVHSVYWLKADKPEGADRDAAEMAFGDLERISKDSNRSRWHSSKVYLITLRSLSILDTVGTDEEQWQGEQLVEQIVGVAGVAKLREIIKMVRDDMDRDRAEEMFDELVAQQELKLAA